MHHFLFVSASEIWFYIFKQSIGKSQALTFSTISICFFFCCCLLLPLATALRIEQTAFAPTYNKQTITFRCPFPVSVIHCMRVCVCVYCLVCCVLCMLIILTNSIEILQAMRCNAKQSKRNTN